MIHREDYYRNAFGIRQLVADWFADLQKPKNISHRRYTWSFRRLSESGIRTWKRDAARSLPRHSKPLKYYSTLRPSIHDLPSIIIDI